MKKDKESWSDVWGVILLGVFLAIMVFAGISVIRSFQTREIGVYVDCGGNKTNFYTTHDVNVVCNK